jgi:integrase
VTAFLSNLATRGKVSASTQNQALAALLFLYSQVLERDLEFLAGLVRAKRPARLPVVMTREEAGAVLSKLRGAPFLMASLLYGSGLRLLECVSLRTKDIDFGTVQIVVRHGKGQADRATLLPRVLVEQLRAQLNAVRKQHAADLASGAGFVALPHALALLSLRATRDARIDSSAAFSWRRRGFRPSSTTNCLRSCDFAWPRPRPFDGGALNPSDRDQASIAVQPSVTLPPLTPKLVSCMPTLRSRVRSTLLVFSPFER